MDEFQGPHIIDAGGHAAAFPQLRLHPPLGRLLVELKAQLLVKPIDPLAIDFPGVASKQDMDPTISIAYARFRDLLDPLFELGLLGALATIVVARPFRSKHRASRPDADLPSASDITDQLAPPIRP